MSEQKRKCKHFRECYQLVYYGEYKLRCLSSDGFMQEVCWNNWDKWRHNTLKRIPKQWEEDSK